MKVFLYAVAVKPDGGCLTRSSGYMKIFLGSVVDADWSASCVISVLQLL